MTLKKLFTFLLLLFGLRLTAQLPADYKFRHLNVSDGLSNNQILSIYKDHSGFLWFGTMAGLNRYDGYSFRIFEHNVHNPKSVSDNYIEGITEDQNNNLWILSHSNYNIYNPVTETFRQDFNIYLRELNIPFPTVNYITRGIGGNVWFVCNGQGIAKFDKLTRHIIIFRPVAGKSSSLLNDAISTVHEDASGILWIIYKNGILDKLDSKTGQVVFRNMNIKESIRGKNLDFDIFTDSDLDVWVTSTNSPQGIFYYNAKDLTFRHITETHNGTGLNTMFARFVTQSGDGNIWVATDHGGVNIIDKKTFKVTYLVNNPIDGKSISQNSINALYRDDNGIIWLGTFKQGVNYYHSDIFRFSTIRHEIGNPESLSYDDINCFSEDKKGNLWIGTNGGGLIYFDRKNNTFKQYLNNPANPNSITGNVIVSLYTDKNNNLWIGTYFSGLDVFDGSRFKHFKNNPDNPQSISNNNIWKIFQDNNNRIFIGTLGGGLDLYNPEKQNFSHLNTSVPNSLRDNFVSSLCQDSQGDIWVGTSNGISILDKTSLKLKKWLLNTNKSNSLSNNNVLSVLKDDKGTIWVGTREGLCCYQEKSNTFLVFTEENGIVDNTINSIIQDFNGNLWVGTPKGLCNLIRNKKMGKTSYQAKNYYESDGLQSKEFNFNAALITAAGELVFGGPAGMNIFKPGDIKVNMSLPEVVLTGFSVYNNNIRVNENINGRVLLKEDISLTSEITLKYRENFFVIEFAALNFLQPEKIRYSYKLECFSKEWITVGSNERKATFTNLDPGEYIFKVKATNNDGFWSEKETTIKIKVLPPFWRTYFAFGLYLLIVLSILYFSRKFILERARMKFKLEQEHAEAQRMHELDMLKIKFFTNVSHEFRTPLSLILAPIEKLLKNAADGELKKQYETISKNAKRLLNLVNQLLDFRKMEVQQVTLKPVKSDLVAFVREAVYSFSDLSDKTGTQLTFETELKMLETSYDPDKLEKILFNLLSNAFKFTGTSGKVKVELLLSKDARTAENSTPREYVLIMVSDNGIGIAKEKQEKIFEPFFQNDVPIELVNQGTGIGLAIVREFVKAHEGFIELESESGQGSCFKVYLPILEPENIQSLDVKTQEDLTQTKSLQEDFASTKTDMPVILLVEDNEDFRFYLKDNLKQDYLIVEAGNGSEGFKVAVDILPDIIVSDVMMPVMDGIELCKKIKSDTRTSHIPLVLLTAKSTEEQILTGIQTGADDYITKPFNFEILLSKIKNIINRREKIRQTFSKHIEIKPGEITFTPLDEQLIQKAMALVETNLSNADFSVEELSRELGMSRVHLYKKLLAITGKSPIEFIRIVRLKVAAQLLSKSQLTISEIAYKVGFNNPKYFSKYFKEEYNMLPSQYIVEQKKME
jgi:signal transduction histidine kinase/ligand-binding sensor domain-containing protein/DNA-binding response OmpR family regulator